MTPDERAQVESVLGRELREEELSPRASFEELTQPQLDVVAAIFAKKAGPTGVIYVRNVLPDVERYEVQRFVMEFDRVMAQRSAAPSPALLRLQSTYEAYLGRAFTNEERQRRTGLDALSPAQVEVARALSKRDLNIAHAYLGEIVQSAPGPERAVFAEHLAKS